jgi:hypothetical protein
MIQTQCALPACVCSNLVEALPQNLITILYSQSGQALN